MLLSAAGCNKLFAARLLCIAEFVTGDKEKSKLSKSSSTEPSLVLNHFIGNAQH